MKRRPRGDAPGPNPWPQTLRGPQTSRRPSLAPGHRKLQQSPPLPRDLATTWPADTHQSFPSQTNPTFISLIAGERLAHAPQPFLLPSAGCGRPRGICFRPARPRGALGWARPARAPLLPPRGHSPARDGSRVAVSGAAAAASRGRGSPARPAAASRAAAHDSGPGSRRAADVRPGAPGGEAQGPAGCLFVCLFPPISRKDLRPYAGLGE